MYGCIAHFTRPSDLVQAHDYRTAMQELLPVVQTPRRFNKSNSEVFEQLMRKYVDLCIHQRKPSELKSSLLQYRSACLNSNTPKLLDSLLQYTIEQTEKRLASARAQMKNQKLDLSTDADSELHPESIIGAVLGDENQDRADRALVAPWLKFVWETYRNVIDVLRHVPSDSRYHVSALLLCQFCD